MTRNRTRTTRFAWSWMVALVSLLALAGFALADDPPATGANVAPADAAPAVEGRMIRGRVVEIRQQERVRGEGPVDEVTVRTRNGEQVRLRLGPAGEAERLGLREGDRVRAWATAGAMGADGGERVYRAQWMRNRRTGMELCHGDCRQMMGDMGGRWMQGSNGATGQGQGMRRGGSWQGGSGHGSGGGWGGMHGGSGSWHGGGSPGRR